MDAATITAASVTLRAAGAGSDVPAAVSYAGGVASLVPNAPLAYNTVYTATVAASVADLAGNQLGTAATWSFTTEAAPLSTLTDTSLADFGAGTFSNTYLADESGGEVILAPTVGAEFGGSSLPAGWESAPVDRRLRLRHRVRRQPDRQRCLRSHHRALQPDQDHRVPGHLQRRHVPERGTRGRPQ